MYILRIDRARPHTYFLPMASGVSCNTVTHATLCCINMQAPCVISLVQQQLVSLQYAAQLAGLATTSILRWKQFNT